MIDSYYFEKKRDFTGVREIRRDCQFQFGGAEREEREEEKEQEHSFFLNFTH